MWKWVQLMLAHSDTDSQPTCRTSTEEGLGKAAKALTVFPVWKARLPHDWPSLLGNSVVSIWGKIPSLMETYWTNDGASISSQELWAHLKFFPSKPDFQQCWFQVGALVWVRQSTPSSPMTSYCNKSPLSTPFLLPALLSASGHPLSQSIFVMSNAALPRSPGFFHVRCVYKTSANH